MAKTAIALRSTASYSAVALRDVVRYVLVQCSRHKDGSVSGSTASYGASDIAQCRTAQCSIELHCMVSRSMPLGLASFVVVQHNKVWSETIIGTEVSRR